ncbi:MAG: O-antigen ligase family protein [Candidatus Gastranaerophilales bacterium]|nr:O-antigen ligase family protein [Candidatus Gastranaerophilales bacterium]
MNISFNKKNEVSFGNLKIEGNILFLLAFVLITLSLFFFIIPIEYIFYGLLTVILGAFFYLKPQYAFYSVILTIPLMKRYRDFPISFTVNEIALFVCTFTVLANILFRHEKINIRTSIDKYLVVLLILFFTAGITSESDNGLLAAFKFTEAILIYYITVYFIRTKQTSIAVILKYLILTAIVQALFGFIQSVAGTSFTFHDNLYYSNRGILGYFGIGSKVVWHGRGTMLHFNSLGYFLSLIFLCFLPIYHYVLKNKTIGKIALGILLLGIITTYSRGSLIAISVGGLIFLSQVMKNKIKFAAITVILILITIFLSIYLSETNYVMTVNPRDNIWNTVWSSITSCTRYLWFGAGLNSYNVVVWPYFLRNENPVFAHDFYLLCIQEMGLIGSVVFLSFFIYLLFSTWKRFKNSSGYFKILNFSLLLVLVEFFINGIFDHSYVLPAFKVVLFLIIGIVYAKDKKYLIKST